MTVQRPEIPTDHPDRVKWNDRYAMASTHGAEFGAGPWLEDVIGSGLPKGPVLELACGLSGAALVFAALGRQVTAVDVSDVALRRLGEEGHRRGVLDRLTVVHADLTTWTTADAVYALVMCRFFWDAAVFGQACAAVAPGGLLVWEGPVLTEPPTSHVPAKWCLKEREPACLLSAEFSVLRQVENVASKGVSRRIIARRERTPGMTG